MARRDVLERMHEHLKQNSEPGFDHTQVGQPINVLEGSTAAVWYSGSGPYTGGGAEGKSLGDAMVTERFTVRCYWRTVQAQDSDMSFEVELALWDATRNLLEAFRGDSKLDNPDIVNDLDVTEPEPGYVLLDDGQVVRSLTFELLLHNLNAEAITA
jgi:hypothetical protein